MARAAQMLKGVAAPVKTVAFDCGYTVVTNFYRDFKRVHGITPMQMRLRHMNTQLFEMKSPIDQVHTSRVTNSEAANSLP
jgi:AraC-like DNA-binding protein